MKRGVLLNPEAGNTVACRAPVDKLKVLSLAARPSELRGHARMHVGAYQNGLCRLAYDADRDGWSADAFHGAVDTFGAAVRSFAYF